MNSSSSMSSRIITSQLCTANDKRGDKARGAGGQKEDSLVRDKEGEEEEAHALL